MTTTLRDRFEEVDQIPSPWDGPGTTQQVRPARRRPFLIAATAAAAVIAIVLAVSGRDAGPKGDASWITATQGMCVEQYSIGTLANRSFAFEGVISDVQGPADPESPDPASATTNVTFDVVRWFWGGTGAETSRRTYAVASSVGELDASVGAELLVAGDEDFMWACGFTQPATDQGRTDFETAAAARAAS